MCFVCVCACVRVLVSNWTTSLNTSFKVAIWFRQNMGNQYYLPFLLDDVSQHDPFSNQFLEHMSLKQLGMMRRQTSAVGGWHLCSFGVVHPAVEAGPAVQKIQSEVANII